MSVLRSLLPILLACAGFWIVLRALGRFSALNQIERLLASFVFIVSAIVTISLGWGMIGYYQAWPVYLTFGAVLTATFVMSRYIVPTREATDGMRGSLRSLWGHLLWPTKLLLVMAAFATTWIFALATLLNDVSFDAMNYHLAWAAYAIQEGYLGVFSTPVPWINVYAKNLDLWYGWFLLNHGNDWLVDFMQWPFALIGVLSLYTILRHLRFSRNASVLASIPFLFLPVVLQQGTTNYVDIAIAALSLLMIAFSLSPRSSYLTALVMGCASGILIGTKPTTIVVVGAAWIIFLVLRYRARIHTARELVRFAGLLYLPAFALSAYWYVRNMVEYGSFVYPLRVTLGPITVIDGLVSVQDILGLDQPSVLVGANLLKNLFANTYGQNVVRYDMVPGSFGPVWAWLALPCLFIATALWVKRRAYARLALAWLFIALFIMTPGHWWWRYVMILFGAGSVALAECADVFRAKHTKTIFALAVTLLCAWSFWLAKWPTYTDASAVLAQRDKSRSFSHRYGQVFEKIEQETLPGTTIAYDSHWFVIYPLWNAHRSNRVVHIPFSKVWLKELRAQDVSLLAAHTGSPELAYLQSLEAGVTLIASDDLFHLYRLAD
jgi:hypothetical protein